MIGQGKQAKVCRTCRGIGAVSGAIDKSGKVKGNIRAAEFCPTCDAAGYVGINPRQPCQFRPGTIGKVATMRRRYREGLELFDDRDADNETGLEDFFDRERDRGGFV